MDTKQSGTDTKSKIAKLTQLRTALEAMGAAAEPKARITTAQAVTTILTELGLLGNNKPAANDGPASDMMDRGDKDVPAKQAARQQANNKAVELLDMINKQGLTRDDLTAEQLEALADYTGSGGGLTSKDDLRGSAYEYYTPKVVAASLWDLAGAMGFSGGKVLDPSAGTGIFAATSPDSAVIDSIELDGVSGGIAKVLNDGDRSNTTVSSFEKIAKNMEDNSLDMVITNVPFGNNKTRGANSNDDDCYQKESLENYFILRSLEKIKHGGLAIFVTPTSVVSGKAGDKTRLRKLTSLKAEFMGAYRLPTSVFEQTGADVVTDVVVYRKHSQAAADQIKELYEAGDIDTLTRTNIFWDDYLSGKYFKEAGKKFVLGDTVMKEDRWGKMTETVVSTKKTPDIAKMLKKFGDSRINWDALGAAEAAYIEYDNGDVIFQDGRQLTYDDGRWVANEREVTDTDREIQELLADMGSAIEMVVAGITYAQIKAVTEYSRNTGQSDLVPNNVRKLLERTMSVSDKMRGAAWNCVIAAQAIEDVIAEHDYGYNFVTGEPALTKFMKTASLDGKNTKLTGEAKQAHKLVDLYYAKGAYNAAWRGDIDATVDDVDAAKSYTSVLARMQYENKSLYLSREQLRMTDESIDPMTDDNWFINADASQVIAADDFLIGSLSNRLADIDAQIAQADDDGIIKKLQMQKIIATDSVTRINLQNVDFDLRSPLISAEDKVRFLIQSVHKDAYILRDEYGKGVPDINVKNPRKDLDTDKLFNRFGDWLTKGTVTIGTVTLNQMTEREALDWLADKINTANINFSNWVKANDRLVGSLEKTMNHEDNLFFTQNGDETPIEIAGMNPELSLHGYQNAFVRDQGRFFGGINGMGVGLGKTFAALASVQHTQNIGAKKKSIFIVPNSVLSNWRKEAAFAYENTDDCMFVGLREKGDKFRVYSNKYDEDLLAAIDGQYRKIFMTFEAFKRIRLKDNTVGKYAEYIKMNDAAFANKELQKDNEKSKGMIADLISRLDMKSNAPYLEDMRVDSVVIDEAHAFKNSISAPETGSRIKYLSQPKESGRGEDAQAKLWYIRSLTGDNDGVQLLTATPITNSPLEIYSMLSLAGGRDTVNKMCGGISGADDFIKVMCQVEEEVMPTIDGKSRSQNVFTGIRNAQILKKAIKANSVIKDADDVGLSVVIPEREEVATGVILSDEVTADLKMFQEAYAVARAVEKDPDSHEYRDASNPQSPNNPSSPYSIVAAKYGETNDLIAHPFNLIRKMDVMIADSEFSDMASFYDFDKEQEALAEKVIEQFNKKAYKEERKRLSPYTNAEDDAKAITKKEDGVMTLKGYKVVCKAKVILHKGRKRIVVDTLNGKIQTNFEDLAEKAKLNLDVTISAKVAAMLDNFKSEQASPRGINADNTTSKIVKQIIFCDHLFLHNKIKRILAKRGGVKAGKIAIITGQVNNEPDQMIDVQDGFNAGNDDNKYQVIIANKKAEVGINLQRGTQAIHHLTTGWTPDSLEQRNGRGARQGNKTERVKIYHYDADGTFDEFKRTMIDKKDEWITSVLSDSDKNTIEVSGSISRAEQDALIRLSGDKEGMRQYQLDREANEVTARQETLIKRHKINMQAVDDQLKVAKGLKITNFYETAVTQVVSLINDNNAMDKKINAVATSAAVVKTTQKRYDATKAIAIDKIKTILSEVGVNLLDDKSKMIEGNEVYYTAMTPDEIYKLILAKADRKDDRYGLSNDSRWEYSFMQDVLRKGSNSTRTSIAVNNDGSYQAAYDEIYTTSRNLIKQSLLSANVIAEDAGYALMDLSDNAENLLVDGQAQISRGNYYEAGAFVMGSGNRNGIKTPYLYMITDRFQGVGIESGASFDGSTKYIKSTRNVNELTPDKVVLASHPDYLTYVKQVAKIEDDALLAGTLNMDIYSKELPLVAEYRDGSISPLWKMNRTMSGQHAGFSNISVAIMMPANVLKVGTPFATHMLKQYAENGIEVNLESASFRVNNPKAETKPNDFDASKALSLYRLCFGVEIRACKLKITKDDITIMRDAKLIAEISRDVGDDLLIAVRREADKLTERATNKEIESIAVKLYDDYAHNSELLEDDPYFETKIEVVNILYLRKSPMTEFDIENFLTKEMKVNIAAAKRGSVDELGLADSDGVYIGGDTMTHKDIIKEYGQVYGTAVTYGKRTAKYIWIKKESVWMVSHNVWLTLIKDIPSLDGELIMKTKL